VIFIPLFRRRVRLCRTRPQPLSARTEAGDAHPRTPTKIVMAAKRPDLRRYAPSGIRTRATTLKGWRPRPLVDGGGESRIAATRVYTDRSGPVAQLVEQGTFNPKVTGSIPVRPIATGLEVGDAGPKTEIAHPVSPSKIIMAAKRPDLRRIGRPRRVVPRLPDRRFHGSCRLQGLPPSRRRRGRQEPAA
jgi:hypothetical protein